MTPEQAADVVASLNVIGLFSVLTALILFFKG